MSLYCVMPWIHVHTRPNGDASPCCVWDMSNPMSNVLNATIDDVANSENFMLIRKAMMENIPINECFECRSKDLSNIEQSSYKSWQNKNFAELIPNLISNTNSDGSLQKPFEMKFMNIRYSNLCNMACRTCGSHSSSLWAQEELGYKKVISIVKDKTNYFEEIFKRLHEVEIINFAGGESILIPEHWAILDRLYEIGKTDVKIIYVTNLSKLSHNNKSIIDYAKIFPNMVIRGSIDASHSRAELYRHGTIWKDIEDNLQTITNSDLKFCINCTIGATNIWHSTDLQQYLITNNFIKHNQFSINMLIQSPMMSAKVLPIEFKKQVNQKILNHIDWCKQNSIDYEQWFTALEFMNSEDHSYLLEDFRQYNFNLDKKRNQNILEVFPELNEVFRVLTK